jgi:hypothetical protein
MNLYWLLKTHSRSVDHKGGLIRLAALAVETRAHCLPAHAQPVHINKVHAGASAGVETSPDLKTRTAEPR